VRPQATAFTTNGVWEGDDPILLVHHSTDGTWQFLPRTELAVSEGIALHLGHFLDRHPDVSLLGDLPAGWAAERSALGEEWDRYESPDD
jgi:hypothetical protein